MQKVYLVLRDNQQTGPFTIGELLQQNLLPTDMIWIEGKSTAWTYLSELELSPFPKAAEQPSSESTITMTGEIEKKAEELRQRILSSAPKTFLTPPEVEIESFRSPYHFSDEEIEFVDHRKERRAKNNTVIGELLLTVFVIGLLFIGIHNGKNFLGVKGKTGNPPSATELNSSENYNAHKNPAPQQMPSLVSDSISVKGDSTQSASLAFKPKSPGPRKILDSSSHLNTEPIAIVPDTPGAGTEEPKTQPVTKVPDEVEVKKDSQLVQAGTRQNNEDRTEEKKGFLKGIFRKKKKDNREEKQDENQK